LASEEIPEMTEESMTHSERCAIYQSVFESCAKELKLNHAKIVAAKEELLDLATGRQLMSVHRGDELRRCIQDWREDRGWFLSNPNVIITLAKVCDVAGTEVATVRRVYSEWLNLPFDITRPMAHMEFLTCVREDG
jgi:hypothetical protein